LNAAHAVKFYKGDWLDMKIRALLFDMDGLLMDTELIHIKAYIKLTTELGVPQGFDAIKRFIGHSHHVACGTLIKELALKLEMNEMIRQQNDIYFQILQDEKPAPLPGVREWFDYADANKLPRALVSSSKAHQVSPTMDVVMNHLDRKAPWREYFHSVCSGDRVERLKPEPDIYRLAIKELNLQPEECVAFEDSPAGVTAAHAAGVRVVAIPNLYLNPEEVVQGKTKHVYKTLSDAYANSREFLS
jgi:HAD superfamily hydrolase (TIGR01509 family)